MDADETIVDLKKQLQTMEAQYGCTINTLQTELILVKQGVLTYLQNLQHLQNLQNSQQNYEISADCVMRQFHALNHS